MMSRRRRHLLHERLAVATSNNPRVRRLTRRRQRRRLRWRRRRVRGAVLRHVAGRRHWLPVPRLHLRRLPAIARARRGRCRSIRK